MSKYDRCSICDYTQSDGSFYADKYPSKKMVRRHGEDLLCDDCSQSVVQNYLELATDLKDADDVPPAIDQLLEDQL